MNLHGFLPSLMLKFGIIPVFGLPKNPMHSIRFYCKKYLGDKTPSPFSEKPTHNPG
jgi:hypothetical protein